MQDQIFIGPPQAATVLEHNPGCQGDGGHEDAEEREEAGTVEREEAGLGLEDIFEVGKLVGRHRGTKAATTGEVASADVDVDGIFAVFFSIASLLPPNVVAVFVSSVFRFVFFSCGS